MIEYLKQKERFTLKNTKQAKAGIPRRQATKTNEPRTSYRITLIAEQTRKFEQFFETEMKDMADLLTTMIIHSFQALSQPRL